MNRRGGALGALARLVGFSGRVLPALVAVCIGTWLSSVRAAPPAAPSAAASPAPRGKPGDTGPPRPVIIIPGLFGSTLVQQSTGRTIWGRYFERPAVSLRKSLEGDRYDGLELPTASTDLRRNRDGIVPVGLLDRETIIPHFLSVNVYRRWVQILGHSGYRDADIFRPRKGETCFTFFYDWRRDIVEAAQLLAERIDAIRAANGDPDLKVDIIAHSMGGLVARYYLLYGGEDVLESGGPPRPTMAGAAHVAHVALLAPPNEGSMSSFLTLLYGGRIAGKKIPFHVWLTLASLYELMPSRASALLLDESARPVDFDMYDVATWQKNQWGIFDRARLEGYRREFRAALGEAGDVAFEAKFAEWTRYVGAALERARRFQAAIAMDKSAGPAVRYHLFGGDCIDTVSRCMLRKAAGGALRPVVRHSERPPGRSRAGFRALLLEPGDGTVAASSLLGLPPFPPPTPDRSTVEGTPPAWPGAEVSWSCDRHYLIQNDRDVQRRVLDLFRSD